MWVQWPAYIPVCYCKKKMHSWRTNEMFYQQVIPPLLLFQPLHCLNPAAQRVLGFPAARELCLAQFPWEDTAGLGTLWPWEDADGSARHCQNRLGKRPSASSVAPLNWELLLLCCVQGAPKPLPWHMWGCWCSLNSSTRARREVQLTAVAAVLQLLLPQTKTSTHQKPCKVFIVEGWVPSSNIVIVNLLKIEISKQIIWYISHKIQLSIEHPLCMFSFKSIYLKSEN